MRPIGFSTGALALHDFHQALRMMGATVADAVELSALRMQELEPLAAAAAGLDLSAFRHVSVHAPSHFPRAAEPGVVSLLETFTALGWPVVVHPDAVFSWELWRPFGSLLLIENMDKRKPIGRTVEELDRIFSHVPDAALCFDLAHARQVDPSMTEAYRILARFSTRMKQIHISEVDTRSRHGRISWHAFQSFRQVAPQIPDCIPIIVESQVDPARIGDELHRALDSLSVPLVPA